MARRTKVEQSSQELVAGPRAAREARVFVRSTLGTWGIRGGQVGDILLAVSELVSNAIEHGEGRPRLHLRLEGKRLEIRVRDKALRVPTPRRRDLYAERGRGLLIVGSLADEWGHVADRTGKWVWAVFTVKGR